MSGHKRDRKIIYTLRGCLRYDSMWHAKLWDGISLLPWLYLRFLFFTYSSFLYRSIPEAQLISKGSIRGWARDHCIVGFHSCYNKKKTSSTFSAYLAEFRTLFP